MQDKRPQLENITAKHWHLASCSMAHCKWRNDILLDKNAKPPIWMVPLPRKKTLIDILLNHWFGGDRATGEVDYSFPTDKVWDMINQGKL